MILTLKIEDRANNSNPLLVEPNNLRQVFVK